MCRQNVLWGCVQAAFGLGLLIGLWIEAGFLAYCIGFGLIAFGCYMLRKR